MSSKSQFPWEVLKAECLRTVCTQLMQSTGAHYSEVRRREDMIVFLNDVEKRGLDKAAQTLQESIKNGEKVQRTASPAKRKAEAAEEEDEEGADGYNTRYKGVKRVKVRAATPERTRTPRNKQTVSAAASTGGAESASVGPSVKRGRGRPRKSIPTGDDKQTVSAAASAGGAESASAGPLVKRGRGRPRKSIPTGDDKQTVSAAASTGSAESASAGPSVKRGRGRPRKSIPTGDDDDYAPPKTGGSTSDAEGNEEPNPSKRGRGRPRKSDVTPAATSAVSGGETSAKRPRGRPRKHPLPAGSAPTSKGKEVFDGVLMKKRIPPAKAGAPSAEHLGEADEGYHNDAAEEDENDDPVLLNGHLDDGTSSLGGSNKENEPTFAEYTPEPETQDADGETDPNVQEEVVITETVQTIDITHSAVIMPTIPMALAAAASNSVPPPDSVQPLVGNSAPQDRAVLHPL
ncbi:hypothetical protein D9619_008656 [Psilocybe cf. subviscida]|uniref:Uncharacterized protein n=1 Tax=Psilocybe cf. subviscida TaxID=2480587 RepID=A0A8H5BAK9_9AGAR|nr:hypothetical protein D9619_008656 [Psilocybe cf. subviscida]